MTARVKTGYVYFVEREDGLIKIGWTRDPRSRVRLLELEHGYLHVHACLDAVRGHEPMLHRRWAHLRVEGEWFRPDEDMWARLEAGNVLERFGGLCRFERVPA